MTFGKVKMVPPVIFFTLVALLILLLPSLILPFWVNKFKGIEQKMESISQNKTDQIISEISKRAELLSTMNSSALNLAKIVDSSLHGPNISFAAIEDHVSPVLFQAISTIPLVSQISFSGPDNLFFSYQYKDDQLLAVYRNSSKATNMTFSQQVNPENGKPNGEPTIFSGSEKVEFFVQSADVSGKGYISVSFSEKKIANFISVSGFYDGYFSLYTRDGEVIAQGGSSRFDSVKSDGTREGYFGNLACALKGFVIKVMGSDYMVSCSILNIFGVQYVYTLVLPLNEQINQGIAKIAFTLTILATVSAITSVSVFVFVILRAKRREIQLCSTLTKQMETTREAEMKYINKSLAFANASHDVRAALAGITGLTMLSREGVDPDSDLGSNLKQIEDCTNDLLGMLNSILDMSKIEAGKMQLEEFEFDLAQLLEDVVDLYHPVGLKKGVDVILDPCDGSIFSKFNKVKGDRTKIRQILSNLLSNAVKFTSEGHVIVRGWAKKPSLISPVLSSIREKSSFCLSSCLFFKKGEDVYDEERESGFTIQENANILEFVFEVEDTGIGIPKEKQNSVFENYVQVKETDAQEGTGLGLGIVQSLVRLMGGEIKIVDKEVTTKGACFRFNIFLTKTETNHTNETRTESDRETQERYSSSDSLHHSEPYPSAFSPKYEHSRVVLFIQGEARRKISKKVMERIGVKVSIVKEWNQLSHTLKKVKRRLSISKYSTSSVSDLSLSSENKSVPLSSMDGENEIQSYLFGKGNAKKNNSKFVLIIIDTSGGPFRGLSRAVADFRKDLENTFIRIVWIDKPGAQNMTNSGLDEDKLPLTDSIISKPFHGSRLYRVIGLLPEFGGTLPSSNREKSLNLDGEKLLLSSKLKGKEISGTNISDKNDVFSGKKFLIVEDNKMLRNIAIATILKLGAIVESCENGEEAVKLVSKGLNDGRRHRASKSSPPYDYILMDCQMPVMDGYEATRRIREEEEYYGVRVPIIALTAHTEDEANQMMQNGIDFFLSKPLNSNQLKNAIQHIDNTTN